MQKFSSAVFLQYLASSFILYLFLEGCAPLAPHTRSREPVTVTQSRIVSHARSFLGTPYRYGGKNRTGMDCSGLVARVYEDVCGILLPHSTKHLFRKGRPVSLRAIQAGDLVFFREGNGRDVTHVGIYLGEQRFIHSSSSRGVIVSGMKESYYERRLAGVRRVL